MSATIEYISVSAGRSVFSALSSLCVPLELEYGGQMC